MSYDVVDDYKVGPGRPPLETRFKKGRSGNPSGRPKAAAAFSDLLAMRLNSLIPMKVKGTVRKVTVKEALVVSLIKRALDGEKTALKVIISCLPEIEAKEAAWQETVSDSRRRVSILERLSEGTLLELRNATKQVLEKSDDAE